MFVNLVEYPAVPVDEARLSLQAMASHEIGQAQEGVTKIVEARRLAEQDLQLWRANA